MIYPCRAATASPCALMPDLRDWDCSILEAPGEAYLPFHYCIMGIIVKGGDSSHWIGLCESGKPAMKGRSKSFETAVKA